MTNIIQVQKTAADLVLGDMFIDWCLPTGDKQKDPWTVGEPSRVLNIKQQRDGKLKIYLDNCRTFNFHPEMLVIVQEIV